MVLVFDIGGTNMRLAVSTDRKTISEFKIIPTPQDFDQGIQILKQTTDQISGGQKIEAVAGGLAGPLDKEKATLVASPHLRGWVRKPLKMELEKIFSTPVQLENDTAMGGLGEATKGAGVGKNIVAYLTVGTGVGGVRIVNGKIDQNSLGFEPGHQIIVIDGGPCNCGGKGHLETYVGGLYIEKKYHQKAEDITDPGIWDEVSNYLAVGLHNITVLWSPDILVLGGSVSKSLPLEKVANYLNDMLKIFPQPPKLVKAALGVEAGLYGALEYLKQNLSK